MAWQEALDRVNALAQGGSAELREALLNLERELMRAEREQNKIQHELEVLQAQREKEEQLLYEAPLYWKERGDKREGPFCQVCWDTSHRLIHLQQEKGQEWVCKVCANTFGEGKSSPFRYNPPF